MRAPEIVLAMLKRMIGATLSLATRASTFGLRCAHSFSRYGMYRQIGEFAGSLPSRGGRVLDISGSGYLCTVIGFDLSDVVHVAYPDVSMLELPFPEDTFDWVVSDQCLEHLEGDSRDAIRECLGC
jgi:SAM-dependent methyltransferase